MEDVVAIIVSFRSTKVQYSAQIRAIIALDIGAFDCFLLLVLGLAAHVSNDDIAYVVGLHAHQRFLTGLRIAR